MKPQVVFTSQHEAESMRWVRAVGVFVAAFGGQPVRCPNCGGPVCIGRHYLGHCGSGVARA
jgi:hypothetical protein